ncbi:hypothetical protein GCM10007857_77540 [Bradyrhizobium iriomotense]|uniref:Uncharacterized protein n=1 Tax=Bradyrhizobium iriomotense TaxID=441950 RepID=A0ABQ6BB93_9BRAD|nr:hypothetical protein GCM10007857_77540 [Bradyrhizobium iriomotense]
MFAYISATSEIVEQIQAAGYNRNTRLRAKENASERSAEKLITKPDITKNISTPTKPLQK